MQETWVQSLGQEDPLEKETATYSSILAWEIPWTEEPGRIQSMGPQRVRNNLATKQQQQQQWLETTRTYYLPVLELRSLQWVGQAAFLLEATREDLLLGLFWPIETTHVPWLMTLHHLGLLLLSRLLWFSSSVLFLWGSYDYIGPSWII